MSLKMRNLGQEYISNYKNYNNNDFNKNIKIVQDDNILENNNNNFIYESCQKPNNNSKKNINTKTKSIQSINSVENKNNLGPNNNIQEATNRNESKLNKYIEIISQDDTCKVTNSLNEKKKKNLDDNAQFSLIPDDGIINSLSSTLSPNKTFSIMNNQENRKNNNENRIKSSGNLNTNILQNKEDDSSNMNMNNTYKTSYSNKKKTSSDNNSKTSNFTLLDSTLNGKNEKEFNPDDKIIKSINNLGSSENSNYYNSFIDEDSKIENNNISKENDSTLQRRTLKKLRHRGGPEKKRTYNNSRNEDYILRDYVVYDECAFNSKDLKCGCTGNLDKACSIF
jgi:CCR4-NOT transcription complex subunit 7/8